MNFSETSSLYYVSGHRIQCPLTWI